MQQSRVRRVRARARRGVVLALLLGPGLLGSGLLLALTAGLLGPAAPASAHATLVTTSPTDGEVLEESPGEVTFDFDEAVKLSGEAVTVFDAAGGVVESVATAGGSQVRVELPAQLADGSYVISWRIVSGDGHPVAGSLTFSVGKPSLAVQTPPAPPRSSALTTSALSLVQGVSYLAVLLAGGLLGFVTLILPRHAAAAPIAARLRRWAARCAVVAVLAALLLAPIAATYQLGLELTDLVGGKPWSPDLLGGQVVVGLLTAAGLAVACYAAGRDAAGPHAPGARSAARARILVLAGAGLAVAAPVWVGHSRATTPGFWMFLGDVVHLIAAAVWLGGLVGLAAAMRPLARRELLAAQTLARFSGYAGGVLLALALTGAFMGWRILGSWSALVETTYGRLLLAKVAIAVLVVGVAAWNRFALLPRLQRAAGHQDRQGTASRLGRAVRAEAALLVAVVLVTGFLVNRSPLAAGGADAVATNAVVAPLGEDHRVVAVMTPGTRGPNTVRVQIQDLTGEPLEAYAAPVVVVRSASVDLGAVPVAITDSGTYSAQAVLPTPGTWEVQVSLRLSEFESPVTTLSFAVD